MTKNSSKPSGWAWSLSSVKNQVLWTTRCMSHIR
uniref:Uncharacterized protein n=1 Tax=Lepeophtheirus salmonis TaxID=72036 RepID=A0A0K2U2X0_LEPSM